MTTYSTRSLDIMKAGFEDITKEAMENLHKRNSNINRNARENIATHSYFKVFINRTTWTITIDSEKRLHNYVLKPIMAHYKPFDFVSPDTVAKSGASLPSPVEEPDDGPAVEPVKKEESATVNLGHWDNYPNSSMERMDGIAEVLLALNRAKRVEVQFDYPSRSRHELASKVFMGMMRDLGHLNIKYEIDNNFNFILSGSGDEPEMEYTDIIRNLKFYARSSGDAGGEIALVIHHISPTKTKLRITIHSDHREFDNATNDFYPVMGREFTLPLVNRSNADMIIEIIKSHLQDIAGDIFYRFHVHKIGG